MARLPRLNHFALLAFEPAVWRGQIEGDVMQFTLMIELDIISDVFEVTKFIIVDIFLFALKTIFANTGIFYRQ